MTTIASDTPNPNPSRGNSAPALWTQLRGAADHSEGRLGLVGAVVALSLLTLIFWSNIRHFFYCWSTDENYSHGFLVPFISLYFANLEAEHGPVKVRGGLFWGGLLLFFAVLAKLATVVIVVGTLGDLAFIAALAGLCALLAGIEGLRRYRFAIGFLIFMVPLPVALYTMIASPLQLAVSRFASVVLNATGVPVLTEGNMMTLPGGVQMFVAEACSGMRQLTGFLALTAAVAYLATRPLWYRLTLVASAVPIAMTANVARVVLTGYIMYFVNPEYASGTYHTIEGLLMLGFGLSLLRGECLALDQLMAFGSTTPDAEPNVTDTDARSWPEDPAGTTPTSAPSRADRPLFNLPPASAGG